MDTYKGNYLHNRKARILQLIKRAAFDKCCPLCYYMFLSGGDFLYYIYMLRCVGNSLYTGITTDISRRFSEHLEKNLKGAKYTRFNTAVRIEAVWGAENRSSASHLEYFLKKLPKSQKEALISSPENILKHIKECEDNYIIVKEW